MYDFFLFFFGRLDKQFQDIMLAIHQVWGPKLVEMENKIVSVFFQ